MEAVDTLSLLPFVLVKEDKEALVAKGFLNLMTILLPFVLRLVGAVSLLTSAVELRLLVLLDPLIALLRAVVVSEGLTTRLREFK